MQKLWTAGVPATWKLSAKIKTFTNATLAVVQTKHLWTCASLRSLAHYRLNLEQWSIWKTCTCVWNIWKHGRLPLDSYNRHSGPSICCRCCCQNVRAGAELGRVCLENISLGFAIVKSPTRVCTHGERLEMRECEDIDWWTEVQASL